MKITAKRVVESVCVELTGAEAFLLRTTLSSVLEQVSDRKWIMGKTTEQLLVALTVELREKSDE